MFEALPGVYVGEGPDLTTPKSKFVRNRLQNCCLDVLLYKVYSISCYNFLTKIAYTCYNNDKLVFRF